jgi:hypothetical protein
VELRGVLLGLLEAPSLVGQGVDHDRRAVGGNLLGAREGLLELPEVVAVDRADVVEPELVPDQVGEEEPFDRALEFPRQLPGLVALGQALEEAVPGADELLVGRMSSKRFLQWASQPTFSEIDQPLSFKTTIRRLGLTWTMLFSARTTDPRSARRRRR